MVRPRADLCQPQIGRIGQSQFSLGRAEREDLAAISHVLKHGEQSNHGEVNSGTWFIKFLLFVIPIVPSTDAK